jgi:4-oxalocrotonate tautomerase
MQQSTHQEIKKRQKIKEGRRMPVIQVNALKQPDIDKKRKLVAKITDVMVEVYGVPRESVVVVIKEDELENVGLGGTLALDKLK